LLYIFNKIWDNKFGSLWSPKQQSKYSPKCGINKNIPKSKSSAFEKENDMISNSNFVQTLGLMPQQHPFYYFSFDNTQDSTQDSTQVGDKRHFDALFFNDETAIQDTKDEELGGKQDKIQE
jgi:hypothetical protein